MVKLRLYDRPLTRSYTGAREEQMSSLYERRSQTTVFAEKFFYLSASRKRVSVEEGSALRKLLSKCALVSNVRKSGNWSASTVVSSAPDVRSSVFIWLANSFCI